MSQIGGGLYNFGNTCFFNSIIQCLFYSPYLSKQLQAFSHTNQCKKDQWCLYCELQKLYFRSKQSKLSYPTSIIRHMKYIMSKFELNKQQDAHEFLRYIIDELQKVDSNNPPQKNRQLFKKMIQNSNIYSMFAGKLKSTIICTNCNFESTIYENYYDISLQCQKSDSVDQSIKKFFQKDRLNGFKCEKCLQITIAEKFFHLSSFPNIVTFHLKRFSNELNKIGKFVHFNKYIDLNQFSKQTYSNNNIYEIYAIIVHLGRYSFFGHYYCYIKNNGLWYRMDDNDVIQVQEIEVLSCQAYLLFYSKKKANETKKQKLTFLQELQISKKDSKQTIKLLQQKYSYQANNDDETIKQNTKKIKLIYKPNVSRRTFLAKLLRYKHMIRQRNQQIKLIH